MLTLDEVATLEHERVVEITDDQAGLHGYIAIHSLARGPSLGGLRIHQYRSPHQALEDVLRLSKAMTYKSAAAGLPFGGGKAVIIGDPSEAKQPRLLEQFGRAVEALGGSYITAEDVGTTVEDLAVVANSTDWVAGLSEELGGSGDPSPATAKGVLAAMKSTAEHVWGSDDLGDCKVLVQGLGKVGSEVLDLLTSEGATLLVADVDGDQVNRVVAENPQVARVDPETCLRIELDIAAPCALGGVLNPDSVQTLGCKAIVGSANNQLSSPEVAAYLKDVGVVYAPDFIVNAGGIINIASEYGYTAEEVEAALYRIGDTVSSILQTADSYSITTHEAAMRIAEERLTEA